MPHGIHSHGIHPHGIQGFDSLTGSPAEDDELLFAVPVCAPYSALMGYKYRLKLTPGAQKRGKASKQAIGACISACSLHRERELMGAVTSDELVHAMLGDVKVMVASAKSKAKGKP